MGNERRIYVAMSEYCRRIIAENGGFWREVYAPGGTQASIDVGGHLYSAANFGPPCSRRPESHDWQDAAMYTVSRQLRMGQILSMPKWFPPFPSEDEEIIELIRIDEIKDEIISLGGWFIESFCGYEHRVTGGIYCREGKYESETCNYQTRATLADWEGLLEYAKDHTLRD